MRLHVQWSNFIPLKDGSAERLIYSVEQDKIPNAPGVYVFGRRWGNNFEALYVGKANDIRQRLRGQFKNLPLMKFIEQAANGKRVVLAGKFVAQRGQQQGKSLPLIERALIRHFLSEGHDLVNKHGTRIRRHELSSEGQRRIIPKVMFLERGKGE